MSIDADVDWRLELTKITAPVHASLRLQGVAEGLVVRGRVETRATHTCHRCLQPYDEEIALEITEVLGLEGDPDGYALADQDADVEPPLRDAVLLTAPLSPTCRADCLGLCSQCGADLNTGACPGHEQEIDSPFAVLRELLEP